MVKKKNIAVACVALAALSGFCYAGGTVNEFTLSNGIKVIHKEINRSPLVTIQLFTHGGSIGEKESQAGLANFTQTLLFQGTKTRTAEKLAQEIEDIGGSLISDVDNDFCTLGMSVLDANAAAACEIVADIALNPSFPEGEIEKERMNALAGIKSRQDHIHQVADDLFLKSFYGNHPYSWPDSGRTETVSKFTREDLEAWHRGHFVPNDMTVVVTGNIPLDKAKQMVRGCFSAAQPREIDRLMPAVQPPAAQKVARETKKFQQAYLMIGYPAPPIGHHDFAALKVMNALLGGRMSGRLFTELREKMSLAYEVNSFYVSRRELSRFVVYMGLEKRNLERAKKRIGEILAELKTVPVPEKELEETKNYIRGVYLLDHQTIGREAWYTGWWEILGPGYAYDEKYLQDLMAVTTADLRDIANKYFTDDYVQVEIVPQ